MKNSRNIKLKTYDDIFGAAETPAENEIKEIDIKLLSDFRDHPFKIVQNQDMDDLFASILENGILVPILVRPIGGKYEIISGHRRKYCAEKANLKTAPCIVRDISYDDAVFLMVDSNIQRKKLLPSEKAFSYKMKLEAIKRQGDRSDLTSRQVGDKSADLIGKDFNDSGRNVQRFIRLTELLPELLEAVDKRKLSFGAGIDLSYLSKKEQQMVVDIIKEINGYPTLLQAKEIREVSGKLTISNIRYILSEISQEVNDELPGTEQVMFKNAFKNSKDKPALTIEMEKIKDFFPSHYTTGDIEFAIIDMLKKKTNHFRQDPV